jgi:hypothetical protein
LEHANNFQGRPYNTIEEGEMEHNPATCKVCQETGDWATTPDTMEFFEKHREAGYEFKIVDGRLIELLAPVH